MILTLEVELETRNRLPSIIPIIVRKSPLNVRDCSILLTRLRLGDTVEGMLKAGSNNFL